MAFLLTSLSFSAGGAIPKQYSCDGRDLSPELNWNDPPAGTKSFAIIVDDPDAPAGTWVHWVIYDLAPNIRKLPEGVPKDRELPDGARQGQNDFRKFGYNGPCPPRGSTHRYFFKLYALDSRLGADGGSTKSELERAMKGHVLAQTELIGKFQH